MRVHLVAGARPNFMKIAPIWHELVQRQWCEPALIHTGQHYDREMSDTIWQELELPEPDYAMGVGSGTHAEQTAAVMVAYEKICESDRPDWLIVVGDVNSTLACTLAAKKMGINVAHLEAGLRSGDRTMPEELNRIMTDSVSDLLWTHCQDADDNLLHEGVPAERIHRVGNIMIDSLVRIRQRLLNNRIMQELELGPKEYAVVTMHRPVNVDNEDTLNRIIRELKIVAEQVPVVFPVHPRTRQALKRFRLEADCEDAFHLLSPLGYLDFISLVSNSSLVITDSGGIQEETTWLGVPCLTVRETTERPVTITEGTNKLVAIEAIARETATAISAPTGQHKIPALWDGETAPRVADSLKSMAVKQ